MPFIGRYTRYPVYPQFGPDPTLFQNILAATFETELLAPGGTVNYQIKTGDKEIRLYDIELEILDSEIDFTILEGSTCVDGVTVLTLSSSDRNSTFASSVFASMDPTGIVGGVPVKALEHFGLQRPILGFGNTVPENVAYITLKFNSNYIFRVQNVGVSDIIDLRVIVLWSE